MNFDYTDKVKDMQARLLAFMDAHIYPNEKRFFAEIAETALKAMHGSPQKLWRNSNPKPIKLVYGIYFYPTASAHPRA